MTRERKTADGLGGVANGPARATGPDGILKAVTQRPPFPGPRAARDLARVHTGAPAMARS